MEFAGHSLSCSEHGDGGDGRPFALMVSFISPHDPYLAPPGWWERYRDAEIDAPQVPDIPLDERDPHSRRHWFLTGRHRRRSARRTCCACAAPTMR